MYRFCIALVRMRRLYVWSGSGVVTAVRQLFWSLQSSCGMHWTLTMLTTAMITSLMYWLTMVLKLSGGVA